MDYYTREQIPILAFDEDPESIARELIRQALCEKPCNIVFIEVRGKLSGVASYGDILRAGKGRTVQGTFFQQFEGIRRGVG